MQIVVREEANRCFGCKNPRCQNNCPINTPIPEIINLLKEGEIERAGERLFLNNPLSLICSVVCPHENNCFGNCIRGIKDTGVRFYEIERYISDSYLRKGRVNVENNRDKRVAVIGSGPSGISAAVSLAIKGYKVTIFEKDSKIGGVLRYGIPNFRLDNEKIDLLENRLKELNIDIRTNILIGKNIGIKELFRDKYEAIFIGTGTGEAKPLNIDGETLSNVHYAIDYLRNPEDFKLGKEVIVIGGGNVAMDAARTAKRMGKAVRVLYRRGLEDMPATEKEIKEAKEEGVEFELFKSPLKIKNDGLHVIKTEKEYLEDGSYKIKTIKGKEEFLKGSSVIIATGQRGDLELEGISLNKYNRVSRNENGETSIEGVFVGGDIYLGPSTVVKASKDGKDIADSIDNYLKNKN